MSSEEPAELSKSEEPTQPLNLVGAFNVGSQLQYLRQAASSNFPLTHPSNDEIYILGTLENLESTLSGANVDTSVTSDITRYRRLFEAEYIGQSDKSDSIKDQQESKLEEQDGAPASESAEPTDSEDSPTTLNSQHRNELRSAVESWTQILRMELSDQIRIPVSSEGLIDIEKSLNDPSMLFRNDSVWTSLPHQTQLDLAESCQTLAVECPTASVFLSLRSVEERLQEWYSTETDRSIEDRTFGQVLSELDDTYDEDSRPPILSHLDYLKDRRNQVAHPEMSPTIQEAESTLVMVRETITNIHQILNSN